MPFYNFHPFVSAQRFDDVPQIFPILIVDDFPSVFRAEYDMILTHPFGMGQTVCLVCHTSHLSLCNRPEHPYCTSKGAFCITFLPTRLAGGCLFHFVQLPKGINTSYLSWVKFKTRNQTSKSIYLRVGNRNNTITRLNTASELFY